MPEARRRQGTSRIRRAPRTSDAPEGHFPGVGNVARYTPNHLRGFLLTAGLTPDIPAANHGVSSHAQAAAAARDPDVRRMVRLDPTEIAPGCPNRIMPGDGAAANVPKPLTVAVHEARPAGPHARPDPAVAAICDRRNARAEGMDAEPSSR